MTEILPVLYVDLSSLDIDGTVHGLAKGLSVGDRVSLVDEDVDEDASFPGLVISVRGHFVTATLDMEKS